ncbi:hypothetical protein KL86PLE_90571 [uncultured Pleomorphomonas sp.]|uniref:Uncharacterized protein n=1 Tax=uncultured Pleomorphomonas sp. TaxID=442121 RepID=A0A212LPZ9_9HYPH|nr:hypothetical protein KL86PLE_90571 [uncultured Pleomorphomonas sp.]
MRLILPEVPASRGDDSLMEAHASRYVIVPYI